MNTDSKWEPRNRKITAWDRWSTKVLSALHKTGPDLSQIELALPIPQNACSFSFGTAKLPLPAGATLLLWSRDPCASGTCPACGRRVVATAFGGLMSVGGYMGQCLGCAKPMFFSIGGLGTVHHHVGPFLEGTPWYLNGATFGGSIASTGADLARVLGLPDPPRTPKGDAPEIKVGRHKMVLADVTFDDKK
jgi:hypothetical protein